MKKKVKKLIKLYESIIHGDAENFGLFQCYDTYYSGCWDNLLAEVETIKNELNYNNKDKILEESKKQEEIKRLEEELKKLKN